MCALVPRGQTCWRLGLSLRLGHVCVGAQRPDMLEAGACVCRSPEARLSLEAGACVRWCPEARHAGGWGLCVTPV